MVVAAAPHSPYALTTVKILGSAGMVSVKGEVSAAVVGCVLGRLRISKFDLAQRIHPAALVHEGQDLINNERRSPKTESATALT